MNATATLPEAALDPKLDLFEEIAALKKRLNAVLLAHYYQEPDIQDVADFIGDSLGLAQQAAKTNADVIVFAGVHFMAETAKILNPAKQVLIPDLDAGCSLADSCPADKFAAFKATGRKMLLWEGTCIVHEMFSERKMLQLKAVHPEALVIAHPECEESVLRHADHIASTTGLIKYAKESAAREFIVVTEIGILHQMKKECGPCKTFYPCPPTNQCACNECPHMKRNTLEKVYLCMRDRRPEIIMDEDIRLRALKPIRRMLEMSA
ncbi:quinolinate synthase NadA [Candidatus Sumerlaeota bacterium]|nr:quinolinate synthase NadA [Candidatus Sumerlaeota bacterium]